MQSTRFAGSRRPARRGGLFAALLAVAAAGQPPAAQQPADSFAERVDVTAVELMIDVRDRRGLAVHGLGPQDFTVLEDGREMKVLGVDYPPRRGLGAVAATPDPRQPPVAEPPPRRFLLYFDLVLTQKRSVRRAVELLEARVDELVAMGPVELVVANPRPAVVVPFTRDGKRLRQELGALPGLPTNHQLASIRRDFLHQLDMRLHLGSPGVSEAIAVQNQIRTAVNKEFLLLNRRLITLGQWIGAYGHAPASNLILVTDGFDLAPAEFYLAASSLPGTETELALELERFRVDPLTEALAREMAARGWTGVVLALGGISELATTDASLAYRDRFRSIGEPSELSAGPESGSPPSIFLQPHAPLTIVTEKTGGELTTARRTAGAALDRIGDRLRLTYSATRAADGRVHRVEVRANRPDYVVRAPRWIRSPTREQTAAARARRLLIVGSTAGELPVRLVVADRDGGDAAARDPTRRVAVEIFFDLNLLQAVLPRPRAAMAFTFGVEIPEAPPLVYEVHQGVTVPPTAPAATAAPWPDFLYRVVLDIPVKATRLSLVVEELASGSWGGATDGL